MLFRRCKQAVSLIVSPLIIAALLINSGASPARASTLQSGVIDSGECPDSLWVTGTEELKRFWEEYGGTLEGDASKAEELNPQAVTGFLSGHSQKPGESSDSEDCHEGEALYEASTRTDKTVQQNQGSNPLPQENEEQGFWADLAEYYQKLTLQAEFPEFGPEKLQDIWEQIERLRSFFPELSFEELKRVWFQIGSLRVEFPELSLDEATVAWTQMSGLRAEFPEMKLAETMEVWRLIRELQAEQPGLTFEEGLEVWFLVLTLLSEVPHVCLEEVKSIWQLARNLQGKKSELSFLEAILLSIEIHKMRIVVLRHIPLPRCTTLVGVVKDSINPLNDLPTLHGIELPATNEVPVVFKQRASYLLSTHGFEDEDGDGKLNWPAGTPVEGQNLDVILVLSETAGMAIGFVPVGGDIYDGAVLVLGRDPVTGECPTRTEMILLAIGIILLLPIPVKTVRVVAKHLDSTLPTIKKTILNSNPGLSVAVRRWLLAGLVDNAYQAMRAIAGDGAKTSQELATKLDYGSFGNSNYRQALTKFTGVSDEAVRGFEAHHVLPKEFEEQFVNQGIDTIHDPRLLVWVDPDNHRRWSGAYSDAWADFFEQTPNPTSLQILDEARELATEFEFKVLFEVAK